MNEAFVLHDTDGYHAYRHVGATHAQRIGPAWKTPRQAVDYAKALDAGRDVSPLRSPGEPSTARLVTSPPGRGQDGRLTERAERPLVRSGGLTP